MLAEPAPRLGEPQRQRHEARVGEHLPQAPGLAQRLAQRREIARAAAPEAQSRQGPLEVWAAPQPRPQSGRQLGAIDQESDCVEARRDRGGVGQRCGEMLGQEPRPTGGDGPVERRQEAAAALAREARRQFEIAPGRRVDLHDRPRRHPPRRFEMRRPALLGEADIIDERAGRGDFRPPEIAEAVERLDPIEGFEAPARPVAIEPGIGERRQGRLPKGEQLEPRRAGQQALGQQNLAGRKAGEIGGQGRFAGRGEREAAGRQIEPGQPQLAAGLGETGEIVVAAGIEQPFLGQGAGGHHPDHGAAQRSFGAPPPGLGRILDLLANRHLEPGADQPGEIGVGGMDRHAAHRNIGAVVPAALGQGDVERLRGGDRVVEEQFEKVAHPEEQEAARIGGLDRVVLRHHRRCRKDGGVGAGGFGHVGRGGDGLIDVNQAKPRGFGYWWPHSR